MLQYKGNGKFFIKFGVVILSLVYYTVFAAGQSKTNTITSFITPLSFEKAIKSAQINDPWLTGNIHQQHAIESMSIAINTLADPKVSIGLANLPTNGFDFGQEGMTQAKIGIAQMFPRGNTLEIKSQQLKIESEAFPYQRQNREAIVAVTVGSLWLDTYIVQQSIALIENNRSLFEQLADVAELNYSSGLGKTRQQDIVRAQLELTRLEDRLNILGQQQNKFEGMLSQWLTTYSQESILDNSNVRNIDFDLHNIKVSSSLPNISLNNANLILNDKWVEPVELAKYISNHPALLAIEKKVSATRSGIKLAEQKYKPEWGVNASYGYRADEPMGNSRADLLSIGVTFDLPFFTENRQDKEVKSAISKTEAIKTEKLLFIRHLLSTYISTKGRLLSLKGRQRLYKDKLLPQIHDQAEASLTAYTNDDGSFSDVVRSRIAVLNAEIDQLTLNVEEQKLILELNYLFAGNKITVSTNNKINLLSNSYMLLSGQKYNERE